MPEYVTELARELRRVVRGEVDFGPGARALYAYDASVFRQVPVGVVTPRDAGDVAAAPELEAVADKLAAPVIKAQLGNDCLPDDSPYTTGPIALVGSRPSEEALEQCDALLIVGSTMPYIEYYPTPGQAACVQIDDKPERIGLRHPVDVPLVGDARATLAARWWSSPATGR